MSPISTEPIVKALKSKIDKKNTKPGESKIEVPRITRSTAFLRK